MPVEILLKLKTWQVKSIKRIKMNLIMICLIIQKLMKYLEELITRQAETTTDVQNKVINYNDGSLVSKYYVNSQGVAENFKQTLGKEEIKLVVPIL